MSKKDYKPFYTYDEKITLTRLFQHYKLLALNRYRWDGLPNNIQSRHIEEFLFNKGQVMFFEDDNLGFMCLPCYNAGALNVYGDAIAYTVTGTGYSNIVKADDGIRILNNDVALPDIVKISHYVAKMTDAEKVMEANIRQQKFPYIIGATRDTQSSMKDIFNKFFEKNEPAIFYDKSLEADRNLGMQVLNLNIPYVADKILKYRRDLEQELLTILGINNTNEKSERMLVDEVNVNNTEIEMNLDLGYKSRKEACDKINEKYGLNVSVRKVAKIIEPTFDTTISKKKEFYIEEDDE